ncbi:MAG TPA: glycosyltransferase family 2 protein [Casimicrobiaceae bacterium]|nr:glycosyltransferase family 2 protein [Casimicrobiaceae bacterium]
MSELHTLSIVIPAYNEVQSLPLLVDGIVSAVERMPLASWEIVLVDDGSTDGTAALMTRLASSRPGIKAVLLRTNFGKSAALMAGFREAAGDVVITMDADLQDDPTEIPAFVDSIDQGYDLVSGWKKERLDPLEKRLASRFFNAVVRKVSGVKLRDNNCGFKAYRRWCLDGLELRGNQHRFIPAILSWRGARIAEIPVLHHKRRFGKSNYGISRYFHGAFDLLTLLLLTKFSQKPLYFFALIGLPFVVLGGLVGAWLLYNHVLYVINPAMGFQLTTRPLLIIAVFLVLAGLLMFLIGLLAELVLRTATLGKGYSVREVVTADSAPREAAAERAKIES